LKFLHGQSSGLSPSSPLFRHAAPVSRASFRSAVHSKRQMQKAKKRSTLHLPFFVVVFTRLSASFVAALHPQHHNFRKLQLPCLCLPPLVNLAVAALPAPSGLAGRARKGRAFALNQG